MKKNLKKSGRKGKKIRNVKAATTRRKRKKARKPSSGAFKKYLENPIISPDPENNWEAWQTFNPGVILLDKKIHFIYRAVGQDGFSRFGYASSNDGFIIDERLPYPVYGYAINKSPAAFNFYSFASGGSFGGAEDPRLTRVDEEDRIYMTYTACDEGLRVGLTSIRVGDFLQKKWKWRPPKLISPPGETHKNWVIFPEKINGKYAILTSINPRVLINYRDTLKFKDGEHLKSFYSSENKKQNNCWDNWVRGAGPPPIKTKHGWLLFYQAMDKDDPGKYKVGAMLLDLNDPTKILRRSPYPILEPEEIYENNGFKAGVVYASGAAVKNGDLLVYYGAADSFVGVAYADLEKFLKALLVKAKPKLKRRVIRKKP